MAGSGEDWRLRRALPDDAEQLAALHLDCWEDAYAGLMPAALLAGRRKDVRGRVERWRGNLGQNRPPTIVAEASGLSPRLLGFATSGPPRDEPAPAPRELWALYVRAAWWGTPVGWTLFGEVLGSDAASLWVLAGNERAIRFYRRQGFLADGADKETEHGREVRMVRQPENVAT